jgi:hypothetical protein
MVDGPWKSSAVAPDPHTSAFRDWNNVHNSEFLRVYGYTRRPFEDAGTLAFQTGRRRTELAFLLAAWPRGVTHPNDQEIALSPQEIALSLPAPPFSSSPRSAPLVLPDAVRRVVALFDAKLIPTPIDLLNLSDVHGRKFGLAHLACFALTKQRGHVNFMRASAAHPPGRVHPQYADNSVLAGHDFSWLQGGSWARFPPPNVANA